MSIAYLTVDSVITIATDDDLSAAVSLAGCETLGLIVPALTAANLTFLVSDTLAGTYQTLKDKSGAALTVAAGAGQITIAGDDLAGLKAYRFVKIATSVGQAGNRTFTWVVQKYEELLAVKHQVVVATIDISSDDDLSDAVDLDARKATGLLIPAIDNAALTFLASDSLAGTYQLIKSKAAASLTIATSTGDFAVTAVDLEGLRPFRFIKIAAAAAQLADRTFKFITQGP